MFSPSLREKSLRGAPSVHDLRSPARHSADGAQSIKAMSVAASSSDVGKQDKPSQKEKGGKKRKKSAAEVQIEQAADIMEAALAKTFSDSWDSRGKNKENNAFLDRLGAHGRKMAALLSDEAAATMSEQLFARADFLKSRGDVIDNLHRNFFTFALEQFSQGSAQLKHIKEIPDKLLFQIVTMGMSGTIDSFSEVKPGDFANGWYRVLNATATDRLSIAWASAVEGKISVQKNLTLLLGDKLLKGLDPSGVAQLCQVTWLP